MNQLVLLRVNENFNFLNKFNMHNITTKNIFLELAKQRYELLKDCYLNISTNYFRKYFKSSLKLSENEYEGKN